MNKKRYKSKQCFITPPSRGWGAGWELVFFLFFFLPSCVETLDIDNDDVKPKIVLNGIIEADSVITVKISKTYPFTNDYYANKSNSRSISTDTIVPNLLPEAKLLLYINDELKGEVVFLKNDSTKWNNGSVFQSSYRPKIGDKVRVEVTAPGFESVWAETVIPQPILIHQVDTATFYRSTDNNRTSNGFYVPEDASHLNLALRINIENPDKKNEGFYALEVYQEWLENRATPFEFFYRRNLDINKDKEPLFSNKVEDELLRFFLEEGGEQTVYNYYFSDKSFDDKKYEINISVWGYYCHRQYNPDYESKPELHDDPLNIEITSMSPELYQVLYKDYSKMEFYINLLSEPKITFSNVHNGTGILGSVSKTKKQVFIPKYNGAW